MDADADADADTLQKALLLDWLLYFDFFCFSDSTCLPS